MRRMSYILMAAAIAGCRGDTSITQPLEAPDHATVRLPDRRYDVIRLPSLAGTDSRAQAINNQGWAAGVSRLPDGSRRAVLWRDGSVIDLGTLGGLASTVAHPGLSDHGMIAGISHDTDLDPNGEQWSCEGTGALPATNPRQACRAFWWENGVMRELPTLGGTHAFAGDVNALGQIVGWAETAVPDASCTGVQVLEFLGAMWDPRRGTVEALSPLPGHSASAATGINDRSQIVGISGECDQAVGRRSALKMALWENGTVTEIPHLGGTTWHTPWAINAQGDVVGFSNLPEPGNTSAFNSHAFLWRYGSATSMDLGTLDDDAFSQANGINGRGQIIGVSHGGSHGARGFIWEDTVTKMVNLNDLIELGADEVFELAHDINDAGVIAGRILNRVTLVRTAALLVPRGRQE